jgi:protein phosphatase
MTQFLRYAAKSDVGMVRRENEDSGYAGRTLLVVADGMGGHAAGELASSAAVATLAELDAEDLPAGDVLTALDDAMLTAAERIAQFIAADPSRAGMGTTLTAMLWRGGRIAMIHIGDSRAYLLRDGELSQITHDHTYVQTLIDAGRITSQEARAHPKRNLILRAIDGTGVPEGETSIREARVGDRYLLCSDGLSGVVDDPDIERVLAQVKDPTAAVIELVDLALAAGAPDNVTAVIADVIEVADTDHDLESALGGPVVVGAAGDRRNRAALPGLMFPDDVGPGDDGPTTGSQGGPAVVGGLASRSQVRSRSGLADEFEDQGQVDDEDDEDDDLGDPGRQQASGVAQGAASAVIPPAPGSVGAAVGSGELPIAAAGAATAVGTAPGDGSAAQREQQPGWLRRHWRGVSAAVAVTGVLLVGALGFLWWLSSQWFVGPNAGYVAIYQGIPQQAAGVALNRVVTRTALPVATLPYYDQAQLEGTLDAATEAGAQRIVTDLEAKSAACSSVQAPLGCPLGQPGTATTLPAATSPATPAPAPSPTGTLR